MLKVFTDASTKGNPGLSGAGLLVTGDNIYEQLSFALPVLTNHEAEFYAVCLAVNYLLEHQFDNQTILLYTDSKIVAQTLEKNYTKNIAFKPYLEYLQNNLSRFPMFIIKWIPEKQNKGADNLARQGLQKALTES